MLFRWPPGALPRRRGPNRTRSFEGFEQRDRDLPESGRRGYTLVESDDVCAGSLRESDQVAVRDRLRGRLEGKGSHGLPEQNLGAAWLGRKFHARILGPLVIQLQRARQGSCAFAHHRLIREQAQEAEHGEPAEQERVVVNGAVPAGCWGVLGVLVPGQRQPDVDVNQI